MHKAENNRKLGCFFVLFFVFVCLFFVVFVVVVVVCLFLRVFFFSSSFFLSHFVSFPHVSVTFCVASLACVCGVLCRL